MGLRHLAPPAAALVLLACGSSSKELQRCSSSADCTADAFCRDGRCIASAPPVAVVGAPAAQPLRSHTVLRFDGSLSSDPDPEDRVAGFAWQVRKVAAGCDPYPTAGTAPALDVVFACDGAFEVELTVTDATGLSSPPAVLPVAIVLSTDVPRVTMGADVSVEHLCQGTPMVCSPEQSGAAATVPLSASAWSATGSAFTYAWSYALPPGLAGLPAPRVTIDPPDGPNPTVRIETDGTAIAGEYVFTVAATDAYRLVAIGQQRVVVGNRPPAITGGGTVVTVSHSFDALGRRFLASGTVPAFTVTDPDGDPFTSLGFAAAHAGDGLGTFDLAATEWAASFAIAVPYATPADALHLLGATDLSRTIAFAAQDVNGARAETQWSVVVANRPPVFTAPVTPAAVNHSYDAASGRYLATATLAAVQDDDGDPVVALGPTGSAICAAIPDVIGSGALSVECALASASGGLGAFARSHAVSVQVGDPWTTLAAGTTTVDILDRAPRVTDMFQSVGVTCTRSTTCCLMDSYHMCAEWDRDLPASAASLSISAVDDDGDPLDVSFALTAGCLTIPSSVSCPSSGCTVAATTCDANLACGAILSSDASVDVTVSDGVASGTAKLTVSATCR